MPARTCSLLLLGLTLAGSASHAQAWKETPVTDTPGALAVGGADFDGDGDADVLSAGELFSSAEIVWVENADGLGTSWIEHTLTNDLTGLRAAFALDMDGDGDPDVLSVGNTRLAWYENARGDGSSWTENIIGAGGLLFGRAAAAGDVDGDGDQDVVAGSFSLLGSSVSWYENTAGNGTAWTRHTLTTTSIESDALATGDLDGDGDLDIAATSSFDDIRAWYRNDGAGSFVEVLLPAADQPQSVLVGDVDCDADLDLVLCSFGDDQVVWFDNAAGDATSFVESALPSTADGPKDVALMDLQVDGNPDILVASSLDDSARWFDNEQGDGSTWTETVLTTAALGASALVAVDLNGDDFPDVVAAETDHESASWYRNPEQSAPTRAWGTTSIATVSFGEAVQAADIDGDGDVDVVQGGAADDLCWYENADGTGRSWIENEISTDAGRTAALASADMDGDGDVDIVGVISAGVIWFENRLDFGAPWREHLIASTSFTDSLTVLDMDGDSNPDVLSDDSGAVYWYANTSGDGLLWTEHLVWDDFEFLEFTAGGDVDNDGDLDVVANDNDVHWFENLDGDGQLWAEQLVTLNYNPDSLLVTDLGADGINDVITGFPGTDEIFHYDNDNGDGSSFTQRVIAQNASGCALTVADVDQDGDPDLFSVSRFADEVLWHENLTGDSQNWKRVLIDGNNDFPQGLDAGDIDGDGDPDAVFTTGTGNNVAWVENVLTVLRYGSGVNPPGSLVTLSGSTSPGSTLSFLLKNPLGTQPTSALPVLFLSTQPDPNFPAGTLLNRFGMAADGAPSELLLSLQPGDLLPALISSKGPITLDVPNDPSLLDQLFFAQGLLLDPTASLGVRIGLTDGVQLEVGP